MIETRSGFAEVNGTRLYYEDAGSGVPLTLIHGFAQDLRIWDPQFTHFARRFRAIRYDLRGFGRSAPEPAASSAGKAATNFRRCACVSSAVTPVAVTPR
jgi:pimeloyl-ACP methyl ester carboxylesterase